MKIGLHLHPDRGLESVLAEARLADRQGFDSVWLSDHLFSPRGNHKSDLPIDDLILATAIGATTTRIKLAWGTLNITLRPPALLAKTLTSLDQITKGRVIATLGSGWNLNEWRAYNLPYLEDHDERAEYAREAVRLFKQLWTHPAPELTTFEGKYVRVHDLPFNPEPYQKRHLPIWFGGDSEATLRTVKESCDGWMMLRVGDRQESLKAVLASSDWPSRPMTLIKGCHIIVHEDRNSAVEDARRAYETVRQTSPAFVPPSFDEFLAREVVGTPDDCCSRIAEFESWGVNYLRAYFPTEAAQTRAAELILSRLARRPNSAI